MVQNANTWSSFVELSWCTCRTAWDTCLFESEGGWFNFLHVFWCRSALWHIHTRRRHAKTIHAIDRFWHTAALEFPLLLQHLRCSFFLPQSFVFVVGERLARGQFQLGALRSTKQEWPTPVPTSDIELERSKSDFLTLSDWGPLPFPNLAYCIKTALLYRYCTPRSPHEADSVRFRKN